MPVSQSLLPRPALFNAVLYSVSALIYSVTLFVLEYVQPGKYLFDPNGSWRDRFSYVAICSWPILFFGSLTLLAIRVCGETKRRKSKKVKKKKKKKNGEREGDGEVRRGRFNEGSGEDIVGEDAHVRLQSSNKKSSSRRRVPRGYVLVTRMQRTLAAFGFLWVAIGLLLTCICGLLVFLGQRGRYSYNREVLGVDEEKWKTWVVPIVTGLIPLLVYGVMALTTMGKFWMALLVRENVNVTETPATSEENDREYGIQVVFEQSEDEEGVGMMRNDTFDDMKGGVVRPDDETIERLLRQLRDMGFPNAEQNIAALEASCFDLDLASDKLMNANAQI